MRALLLLFFVSACNVGLAQTQSTTTPENAWASGGAWYCNDGYRETGNQCIAISIPENAWAYADHWYCDQGYIRQNDLCIDESIFVLLTPPSLDITIEASSPEYTSPSEQTRTQQTYPASTRLCAENGSCYGDISEGTGRPKTVPVQGYYRSDGTYVRGYYRSSPQ
jgi:hypothetical protein